MVVSFIYIAFMVVKLYIIVKLKLFKCFLQWSILRRGGGGGGVFGPKKKRILLDFAEVFTRGSNQVDQNSVIKTF